LLDTVLEPRQYFYVVAAPLPLVDGIEGRPTILLVTLSLDATLQTAAATATANESSIQLDFVQVLGDTATILASTDDQTDGRTLSAQDLASVGPAQQAAQIILGDIDFRIRASYGSLDLLRTTERQLVLLVEALVGFALAALVLSLRLQSDRRDHERIRREALLSAALRGSPGWTAIIDGDNRVELTNDGPFHVPQGDLVESSALWGAEAETVSNLRSLLARARTGETSEMQVLWSDPKDVTLSMRIVEVSARPMPGVRLVLLQCIDVTEMRDRAMRTSQSERMEAIGVLAGGLAHDFNNLLFITLGYLQMLERQPLVAGDQQARTYVGRAVEAVERGAKVAKSLLSFARSQPLAASRVDLDDYIKDLTPLIEQAIGSAHQLRIEVEGQLGVVVDPGRLSSALLNVVFNARDAMETKGQLTLRVAREMAAPLEQEPRPVIAISISDTGKGMPAEVAARAFEPFFTTKKVGSGTGLGLATLYSFAQQSGGWAAIDSTEGVGTTISLYLPPADDSAADELVEERDATLTTRALVLDDEPALADLVAAWLGDLGIATRTANTPEAALRVAREFKPQLVMSDANLNAELDGLEVARLLVEEHPSLIVVFMTGFSDRIKALQAAGVATLAKPFSREDLLATLSKTAGLRWERGPRG
ncbi:MAG: ATP-binding protein, partial [Ilumatobacteraceae bacterium]